MRYQQVRKEEAGIAQRSWKAARERQESGKEGEKQAAKELEREGIK